jgi:hypothetical protein
VPAGVALVVLDGEVAGHRDLAARGHTRRGAAERRIGEVHAGVEDGHGRASADPPGGGRGRLADQREALGVEGLVVDDRRRADHARIVEQDRQRAEVADRHRHDRQLTPAIIDRRAAVLGQLLDDALGVGPRPARGGGRAVVEHHQERGGTSRDQVIDHHLRQLAAGGVGQYTVAGVVASWRRAAD